MENQLCSSKYYYLRIINKYVFVTIFKPGMPATGWLMPDFLNCICLGIKYVCIYLYPPPSLSITSGVMGMMWIPYDRLKQFYDFYVAVKVSIIIGWDIRIEKHHGDQPNKSMLALCKLSLLF